MATVEFSNDFCPSCGEARKLNSVSGFCIPCTKLRFPDSAVCDLCGRIERRGQFRVICQDCEREQWLAKNADKIEAYMAIGLTTSMAFAKVSFDNRPTCLSCGNKIKGGRKGWSFFCSISSECRSAGIKFKHLRGRKGLSREDSLRETLGWLNERRSKQVA